MCKTRVIAALSNPSCGGDTLKRVAGGSACDAGEILLRLAEDEDETVRRQVVSNPSCSDDTLTQLSHDPSHEVRRAARDALTQRS